MELNDMTRFTKYAKLGSIEVAYSSLFTDKDEGDCVGIDFHDTTTGASLTVNYKAEKGVLSMKQAFEDQKKRVTGDKETRRQAVKFLDKVWNCYRLIAPFLYLRARLDYFIREDRAKGQFLASEIALYLMSIDTANIFRINEKEENEGTVKLNIMLQMIQNIGYAYYYGGIIMDDLFYIMNAEQPTGNSISIPTVMLGYKNLVELALMPFHHIGLEIYDKNYKKDNPDSVFVTVKDFIYKIYTAFKNAPLEDLKALSKEDPEYRAYVKEIENGRLIDIRPENHNIEDYREQYKDFIDLMFGK